MIFAICSAAVILALTIIAMASCIKVVSDEFNWMEQKYYARLKELDLKKRRMKMSECVKETKCTSCSHRAVCMHKIYFLQICEAVDKAKIYEKTEHGYCEHPISSYDCFGGVDVKCKYYAIDNIIVEIDPDDPSQLIKRGGINTCSNHI